MKEVVFSDVSVNQKFTYENNEYIKTDQKKISCCKFINAHLVGNTNQTIGIRPNQTVKVDTE